LPSLRASCLTPLKNLTQIWCRPATLSEPRQRQRLFLIRKTKAESLGAQTARSPDHRLGDRGDSRGSLRFVSGLVETQTIFGADSSRPRPQMDGIKASNIFFEPQGFAIPDGEPRKCDSKIEPSWPRRQVFGYSVEHVLLVGEFSDVHGLICGAQQ
jgi:hypothetical protein